MSELLDFDDLMQAGSKNFKDRFSTDDKTVEEKDYGDRVPVAREVNTGEIIYLPFENNTRILLCAKSREGKTVLGKAYLSRVIDKGGVVFAGTDIKNDFQSFDYKNGVSQELVDDTKGLLRSEKPKIEDRDFKNDFAKRLAIPYFMKGFYDSNPRNIGSLFAVGFPDITKKDFKKLIGMEDWRSNSQYELMDDILSKYRAKELTWEFLYRKIGDEGGQSSRKLERKLNPYKNEHVIGSKGISLDNVVNFEDVNLVSLGLKGIDYAEDSKVDFYASLAHRMFLEKCKNDEFSRPRVLYDDEAHEVLPSDRETQTKDEVALAFSRKGGQADVATVLSSQEPHKIPSQQDKSPHDFVSPTSHAFVGRGLSWPGYRTVFSAFSIYDSNNTQPLRDLKDSLDKYQFLYIDQSMDSIADVKVVESLAPLVSHPG